MSQPPDDSRENPYAAPREMSAGTSTADLPAWRLAPAAVFWILGMTEFAIAGAPVIHEFSNLGIGWPNAITFGITCLVFGWIALRCARFWWEGRWFQACLLILPSLYPPILFAAVVWILLRR